MNSKIIVTCGLESTGILKMELENLGYKVENVNKFDVVINGDLTDCMRLNMHLRTAHRVLFRIQQFQAKDPDELYKHVKSFSWEKLLNAEGYFSINSHVINNHIKDTRFANLRVKDAIVDKIYSKMNKRPNSGPNKDKAVIFLYWVNHNAELYIDTSGITIAKHNYRKAMVKAPLMESLAATIIFHTKYSGEDLFINPMCGSGTLAIEAALIALNMAPGLFRTNFGFMHLMPYAPSDWSNIKKMAHKQIKKQMKGKIIASDHDAKALQAARSNAELATVSEFIEFIKCDFQHTPIPEGPGQVIFNPPYGNRIGEEEELIPMYENIGNFLKQQCIDKTGYIFTGNPSLAKKVGLRTSKKIPLFNAKIECRLLAYEMYSGTKKQIN